MQQTRTFQQGVTCVGCLNRVAPDLPCHSGFLSDSRCKNSSTEAGVLIDIINQCPTPPERASNSLLDRTADKTPKRDPKDVGTPKKIPVDQHVLRRSETAGIYCLPDRA
ncbi:hypothetical protein AVEN_207967-1 [Araneus ventricosus]|uniref:Uncharacterized protein n=1 Tax=Araneus ventricosus TaxID=182803 RepID=A0A4Y2MKL9_ARAVE|nr:hypothetical protein AVEN_207967-1 [Araneus ventricosus]